MWYPHKHAMKIWCSLCYCYLVFDLSWFPFPKEFEWSALQKKNCCRGEHWGGLTQDPGLEWILFSNMIAEIIHGDIYMYFNIYKMLRVGSQTQVFWFQTQVISCSLIRALKGTIHSTNYPRETVFFPGQGWRGRTVIFTMEIGGS